MRKSRYFHNHILAMLAKYIGGASISELTQGYCRVLLGCANCGCVGSSMVKRLVKFEDENTRPKNMYNCSAETEELLLRYVLGASLHLWCLARTPLVLILK